MISFRYHVVTIIAVFMAIGLGVLVGTTVLDQGIVSRYRATTEQLGRQAEDLRTRVGELEEQVSRLELFAEEALPFMVSDRLLGRRVVVVTHEGVTGDLVGQARQALEVAGAEVVATIVVDARMDVSDPARQRELAEALGVPVAPPDALAAQAGVAVAVRLDQGPPDPLVADPATEDVLVRLLSRGFLVGQEGLTSAELAEVGGEGQIVVVLAGGEGDLPGDPGVFLIPLIQELVSRSVPTAAGESLSTDYRFVPVLRRDEVIEQGGDLVTVDDLSEPAGGAALVLALEDLILYRRGGHFGTKEGAQSILPPP
ncbi:MAG: copper transporter [Actinobacteria bacterium]|nr:copper transporter [Actinomycetota bacterium]